MFVNVFSKCFFFLCSSANVDIQTIAIKKLFVFTPHGILAVHVFYYHSLLAHSTHPHTLSQFHLMLPLLVRVISILSLVPRLVNNKHAKGEEEREGGGEPGRE